MLTFSQMFCSCRGVSLSQELCCTQLARLFAREHSNREKRVKFDQGFTGYTACLTTKQFFSLCCKLELISVS